MQQLVLGLLVFASSAFALDIDISAGQAKVTSATSLEITNVKLGNLLPTVTVALKWNSVTGSFVIDGQKQQPNVGEYVGKWRATIQSNCVGTFSSWLDMQFLADGNGDFGGSPVTWSQVNGQLDVKWTQYPEYTTTAEMMNNELSGVIFNATQKWCWKGTRIN